MTEQEHKIFIRFLIRQLRETHHELNAYRTMAYMAGAVGFPVEEALNEARESQAIRKRSDDFVAGLEEFLEKPAQKIDDRALHEFLQRYVPLGKPN